jgi:hypothetical protein
MSWDRAPLDPKAHLTSGPTFSRLENGFTRLAVRVIPYKDRIKLQLPSGCPLQPLLKRITELLYLLPAPAWDTS